MSSNFWKIDEEALDKLIFEEFHKTKEDLNEYISIMKEWVKTQPHLPEEPSDILLRFIVISNKFSIEKAKQKLDMYYTIRSLMPEFYTDPPSHSEMVLQSRIMYAVPLPKTTPDFKRIVYAQINPKFGPEFFNQDKVFAYYLTVVELLMQEEKCYNFVFIMDCKGFQLSHIPKVNPMNFKKASIISEKVYSNRIASIYLVNCPKFVESFLNTAIKPALNAKVRDRFKIYQGTDILLEEFGKSIMPKDIGGEEKSLDELTDCVLQIYEARRDRFEVLKNLRVDESLRPQKLINNDILGYYGNFKKIDVD